MRLPGKAKISLPKRETEAMSRDRVDHAREDARRAFERQQDAEPKHYDRPDER
jgi:hypothetical protein